MDTLELRTATLLHEAVEQVIHHSERQRRSNYIKPPSEPNMSVLNDFLDSLIADE